MLPSQHRGRMTLVIILVLLTACTRATSTPSVNQPSQTAFPSSPTTSPTPAIPTPTPEPAAAVVNGQSISLANYAAELERYLAAQKSLGKSPTGEEAKKAVLDAMVDRTLLAQAAEKGGYTLSDQDLKTRADNLASQLGGEKALQDWQTAHGYTPESFLSNLKEEVTAAWERDQITGQVPAAAEQIHARQILVQDSITAQKVLDRLNSGTNFATLALKYDPVTGGDLGWFPQGYLEDAQVESAVFALQPGQVSQVIQSPSGYHVIEVIERDPQRPLNTDQRLVLQQKALQKWLEETRANGQIKILIP